MKLLLWAVFVSFCRYKDNLDYVKCDLLQPGIFDVLKQLDPDVIVHSAAERFPDKVEKDYEKARELNVNVPENLAKYSCTFLPVLLQTLNIL